MSTVIARPRAVAAPSAIAGAEQILTAEALSFLAELQSAEFASEAAGYTATRHQREVGTGYFDAIATAISAGQASTVALSESTEAAQFVAAE